MVNESRSRGICHRQTSPYLSDSVTRLGDFQKLLATNLLAKEAQMIGYFEKPHSFVKTASATFWGKIGLLFTPTSGHTTITGQIVKATESYFAG